MLNMFLLLAALLAPEDFHPGSVIEGYGKIATIPNAAPVPKDVEFKIAFDVTEAAEPGAVNRRLDAAARHSECTRAVAYFLQSR